MFGAFHLKLWRSWNYCQDHDPLSKIRSQQIRGLLHHRAEQRARFSAICGGRIGCRLTPSTDSGRHRASCPLTSTRGSAVICPIAGTDRVILSTSGVLERFEIRFNNPEWLHWDLSSATRDSRWNPVLPSVLTGRGISLPALSISQDLWPVVFILCFLGLLGCPDTSTGRKVGRRHAWIALLRSSGCHWPGPR